MAEEIIEQILWTETAKNTFSNIIKYLGKEWTEKEIQNFISRTTEMLSILSRYPEMCRQSSKRKNVRICILTKHTQLVYHYKPRKRQIEILLFWNFKQNPGNFKY